MKKTVFIFSSIIIVGILCYNLSISNSQATSNISYSYEYYYNENESLNKDAITMNNIEVTPVITTASESYSKQTVNPIDTAPDSYTVLVNKDYPLPEDYIPDDLVVPDILFNINTYSEKKLMRQEAATALEALFQASEDAGLSLYGISGYRSYKRQKEIYDNNVKTKGIEATNLVSASPGHSEHQTGLTIDVSTPSIANRLEEVFFGTPEGKWLADHAHLYGFIIRYPKDKSSITGYSYEPWHIRYVGKDLAELLYETGETLEEYYNYKPNKDLLNEHNYGNIIDIDNSSENDSEVNQSDSLGNNTETNIPDSSNNKLELDEPDS